MRILLTGFVCLTLLCGVAAAQVSSKKADARGQVFLPNGSPAEMIVRIQLTGEDGQRPPEYIFTDSKGTFGIRDLVQGGRYMFAVESDGKNWGASSETVYVVQGSTPFITIHLRPLLASPFPERPSISAAELNQNVPPAAKREYEYAVASLAAGDLERAGKQFERAIHLFPDFVEARSELAVVRMRRDDLSGAEALLRRALEIDAAAVRPLLNLGLCLYRQQRFAEALPALERGVQLQPGNAHGNLLLGIVLFASGDAVRAEAVLRKAYDLGGQRAARAQLYLSRLYAQQQKYDLAAQALETYLKDAPAAPDAAELQATLVKLRAAARP
jgi:tetratricopeptide (TPR) repeat protein